MRFVVGLGNPGERYRRNRHNVGFMAVDALLERAGRPPVAERGGAWVAEAAFDGERVLLVKPLSFMNGSGVPVARILEGRGGSPSDLVVVLDDVALDLGRVRIRERGGHGGHNGLRSLIDELATEEFARVRVGVRKGELPDELAEYVLADFPPEDVLVVQEMVGLAADAALCVASLGVAAAMNRFNVRPA